ncbi:5'-nucleotidase [Kribbella sp. NPDC026596]|uniref:5'-nucleotidase n=1 Tax=Kribbella sp. NPDC026596 TaxID=3155122 RepID=UPI0033D576DA
MPDGAVVKRVTHYAKGVGAVIGVLGTAIATLFLLIDHGVFGGGDDEPGTSSVNTALRQLDPPLGGGSTLAGESALGNLVADARRHATQAHIAFVNPGAIRAPIKAGLVTSSDLAAVLPFNNRLVTIDLTGAQIWAVLRQQFQAPQNRILQVAGLRFVYHLQSANEGDIDSVELLSSGAPPAALSDDTRQSYTVVVDSFLADGGDGFSVLADVRNRRTLELTDQAAPTQHVAPLSTPFEVATQQRIMRRGI